MRAASPEGVVRLNGGTNNGACASGLSGRKCSTSRECTICVFWISSASKIEMPMLPPRLRIKLRIAVPCVRMCRGRLDSAIVFNGTKVQPSPKPCSNPDKMTGAIPICSENPVICHSDTAVSPSPIRISSRVSTLPIIRPTTNIAAIVPKPRVAVTRPVVITG